MTPTEIIDALHEAERVPQLEEQLEKAHAEIRRLALAYGELERLRRDRDRLAARLWDKTEGR